MADNVNPLAQIEQPFAQPVEVQQPSGNLPQEPALSPVEKAQKLYEQERLNLIRRQQELVSELEGRVKTQPGDYFAAIAQGFGNPQNLSFASGMAGMAGNMGSLQANEQKRTQDLAKMKLELQMQELGMRKEDVELARNRQLSNVLSGVLSGSAAPDAAAAAGIPAAQASAIAQMPPEYRAMILAQLQTGDVKGAIAELNKYLLESTKKPEKVKEFEFYVGQLKSPAARSIAQQMAANNYFLGSPGDRTKTILEIRKAIDQKTIPENEGNLLIQGLTSIGGEQVATSASGSDGVYRSTRPTEQEARSAAINADAAGVPFSIGVQPKSASPSAAVVTGPQSVSDVQSQPDQSILSNEQKRLMEQKKQEDIISRKGKTLEDVEKDIYTDFKNNQKTAEGAFSTINSMELYKKLSPNAAAGGVQPVFTGLKNIISSFGFTPESLSNEQIMSSAIDHILTYKMKELGARGLTDTDLRTIRNSLPNLNTSKEARIAVANIVQKANTKVIDQYRVDRLNLGEKYPDRASSLPFPNFYKEWISQTEDAENLKRRYASAKTQEEKEKHKKVFDSYYGFGAAEQFVGK